jgi:dolichol-phosphate mannosyltransferase
MVEVSVIVPTYREAENLSQLTARVDQTLATRDYEIVIVDDNSPDDTVAVCSWLTRYFPVRLIVREQERGLSSAVMTGLREASGSMAVVMDGDLSYPPESIPELLAPLETGRADFVIGSRYVEGASAAQDWRLFRRVNSLTATLLARALTTVRDPMAGYFALHKTSFVAVETDLDPVGPRIGVELLVKGGFRHVVEVPIQVVSRARGRGKLNFREQARHLQHLARLYKHYLTCQRSR